MKKNRKDFTRIKFLVSITTTIGAKKLLQKVKTTKNWGIGVSRIPKGPQRFDMTRAGWDFPTSDLFMVNEKQRRLPMALEWFLLQHSEVQGEFEKTSHCHVCCRMKILETSFGNGSPIKSAHDVGSPNIFVWFGSQSFGWALMMCKHACW